MKGLGIRAWRTGCVVVKSRKIFFGGALVVSSKPKTTVGSNIRSPVTYAGSQGESTTIGSRRSGQLHANRITPESRRPFGDVDPVQAGDVFSGTYVESLSKLGPATLYLPLSTLGVWASPSG